MATPEATLKTAIRDHIKSIGGYCFKPVQMGMGEAGVDIYACVNGHFVAIEAKAPGKYKDPWTGCTPRQKQTLHDVSKAGGTAFATDDLEKTAQILGRLL